MKKRINKIAATFVVAIFALSGLGIAYSAWTDTITIGGTVETGSLCWEFVSCSMMDEFEPVNPGGDYVGFSSPYADKTCEPGFPLTAQGYFWNLDKNVGWGVQQRQDNDGDGFYETLEITLNNVYPCYFNELSFYVRNCGSIPLKFDHILINGVAYNIGQPYVSLDLSGNGEDDFEIWWREEYWGYQLEPGDPAPEFSFWMHVLQDEGEGVQGESFTFTLSLVGVQWNEYPLPSATT